MRKSAFTERMINFDETTDGRGKSDWVVDMVQIYRRNQKLRAVKTLREIVNAKIMENYNNPESYFNRVVRPKPGYSDDSVKNLDVFLDVMTACEAQ